MPPGDPGARPPVRSRAFRSVLRVAQSGKPAIRKLTANPISGFDGQIWGGGHVAGVAPLIPEQRMASAVSAPGYPSPLRAYAPFRRLCDLDHARPPKGKLPAAKPRSMAGLTDEGQTEVLVGSENVSCAPPLGADGETSTTAPDPRSIWSMARAPSTPNSLPSD
jgi:hypothetical protein